MIGKPNGATQRSVNRASARHTRSARESGVRNVRFGSRPLGRELT